MVFFLIYFSKST